MAALSESRISRRFAELKSRGECALVTYLTAGFPAPDHTAELLEALVRGGADIIELGVPFSDPIADGPTIQKASSEALGAGTTVHRILDMVREFRKRHDTPLVLFGAYNPFFHYGMEGFLRDAAEAGADGILIPDLPLEEGDEVAPLAKAAGLDIIFLVAPTTPIERKRAICARSTGFVYYISVKGVTGKRTAAHFQLEKPIAELRQVTDLPVAVGFGISEPAQAAEVAQLADGVVVGSGIVDLVSRHRDDPALASLVSDYCRSLKDATRTRGSKSA